MLRYFLIIAARTSSLSSLQIRARALLKDCEYAANPDTVKNVRAARAEEAILGIAQINPEYMEKAEKEGVEILCFPELSLTGATCGDLFFRSPCTNFVT